METIEKQISIKAMGDEKTVLNSSIKSHNPGLRALLAIKKFNAILEKDYAELQQIEKDLNEVYKKALLILDANNSPDAIQQWKDNILHVNNEVKGINDTLIAVKERIEQKATNGYAELWKQLSAHLIALNDNSKNASLIGLDLLPEVIHPQWKNEFVKIESQLMQSLITHVESCRVLLQIIERYTPDELNTITQIIVNQIPLDFTYEEAVEYQKDYYKNRNFKRI
ncbi:MAG: hypothetical protein IPH42_20540 [Bacteroidetes bacterium]|nr:hypothetical protein [Bacteroidota bacterium]